MSLKKLKKRLKIYLKDRLAIIKGTSTKPLNSVYIDLVGSCTNKCFMCPARAAQKQNHKMSDSLFEKIIEQLAEKNYSGMIHFYGQCEPFLDKNIFEKIHYTHKKLPNADLNIISNFTVLDDAKIDNILKLPNIRLSNSIYSLIPEIYSKICGRDNFKLVFINLVKMLKKHAKIKSNVSFSIYLISLDYNKEDEQFAHYFLSLLPISYTARTGLVKMKGILSKKSHPNMFSDCASNGSLKITDDGEVTFCSCDQDNIYSAGNINEENIFDILNNKKAKSIRRKIMFSDKRESSCIYCDYGNIENKFLYFLPLSTNLRKKLTNRLCNPWHSIYEVNNENTQEQITKKLQKFNEIFKDGEEDKWLEELKNLRNEFYVNRDKTAQNTPLLQKSHR